MELTREEIESYKKNKDLFGPHEVHALVEQLLAEMDKPGVWDNAPEWVNVANIKWTAPDGRREHKTYIRELPKSRERQIAEELSGDTKTCHPMINGIRAVDVIEKALLKYNAELEAGR